MAITLELTSPAFNRTLAAARRGVVNSGMGKARLLRIKCTNLANSLIRVGMTKKHSAPAKFSAPELPWLEPLREHPQLRERFARIMEIAGHASGPLKSADEVEGVLIQALRRLGHTTMADRAARAEQRLAEQLKQQDASARVLKKNAQVVVCLRRGERAGTGLGQRRGKVSALAAHRDWRPPARTFGAFGAGVDKLWLRAFLWARGGTGAGTLQF